MAENSNTGDNLEAMQCKHDEIKCKGCKKTYPSNVILRHLRSLYCRNSYSEEDLEKLKEEAKDRAKEKQKEWFDKYDKIRYQENQEKILAKKEEYHDQNRDKINQKRKDRYQKEKAEKKLIQDKESAIETQEKIQKYMKKMPEYKKSKIDDIIDYLDFYEANISRWMKNFYIFRETGKTTNAHEKMHEISTKNVENFHGKFQTKINLIADEIKGLKGDTIIHHNNKYGKYTVLGHDFTIIDEKFEKLQEEIRNHYKILEKKIAFTLRDIGKEIGVEADCGACLPRDEDISIIWQQEQNLHNNTGCAYCRKSFFKIEQPFNKTYRMKRTPINCSIDDLENEEEEEEYKPDIEPVILTKKILPTRACAQKSETQT